MQRFILAGFSILSILGAMYSFFQVTEAKSQIRLDAVKLKEEI